MVQSNYKFIAPHGDAAQRNKWNTPPSAGTLEKYETQRPPWLVKTPFIPFIWHYFSSINSRRGAALLQKSFSLYFVVYEEQPQTSAYLLLFIIKNTNTNTRIETVIEPKHYEVEETTTEKVEIRQILSFLPFSKQTRDTEARRRMSVWWKGGRMDGKMGEPIDGRTSQWTDLPLQGIESRVRY